MHGSSSNINVPVDVSVAGRGRATRDGRLAPSQSFARIERGRLRTGDWLLNPGTNQLHRVVSTNPDGVTITVKVAAQLVTDPFRHETIEVSGGIRHVVSYETWDDVIAALWLVVE